MDTEKITILLADKNELFRKGLEKLLEEVPHFRLVGSCSKAHELIESSILYQPKVIVVDSDLFDSVNIEAMLRIKESLPDLGVILLNQSTNPKDIVKSMKAGARGYLTNDTSLGNLIETISLVAQGSFVISPAIAAKLVGNSEDSAYLSNTHLSKRERTVLDLVSQGLTNKEIATNLVLSEHTVRVHMRNIMEKLHAHTRQEAVALAIGRRPRFVVTDADAELL